MLKPFIMHIIKFIYSVVIIDLGKCPLHVGEMYFLPIDATCLRKTYFGADGTEEALA